MDTQPPERFLAHKTATGHHAFCTLTTTYAVEKFIPNQQAYHCIPNRCTHAARSINAISLAIRFYPGVAFQRVLVRYRTESSTGLRHLSCGWWWSMANRGKWKRRRRSCISITVKCRSPRHRKKFWILPLLPQAQRQIRPRQAKISGCLPLYQIRNKRMTGALC